MTLVVNRDEEVMFPPSVIGENDNEELFLPLQPDYLSVPRAPTLS